MQTAFTGHVDRMEWRWVTLISVTLLLVAFSPYILIALINPPAADWQFMGALHDYHDGAASLSRMQQGSAGNLLVTFMHTTEAHRGTLIQPIYPLLGQLSRFTIRSTIVTFHLARMIAAFFMYLAIYQLGATIWVRVRTRRIFFIMASLGTGLGWIYTLFTGLIGDAVVPDLMLPQLYPFYSAAVNVHYPIAIGCSALVAAVMVRVFRPGENENPGIENGGGIVFLSSLTLAFVYPDAILPLNLAYILSAVSHWIVQRRISIRELRWWLWILVPALPVIAYDLLVISSNDVVAQWVLQRGADRPSLLMLIIGIGIPLLVAVPGIIRAFRRYEPDGDRLMLLWLLSMLITMLLPLRVNQYALLGLMLPIAYFAARAIEDFWFAYVKRRYRGWVYVIGIIAIVPSHLMWLYLPVLPIIEGWSNVSGNVLEQGYPVTFDWLKVRTKSSDVVMTHPEVGAWVPVWIGTRTVYGHPSETLNASEKRSDVNAWYAADTADDPVCQQVIQRYRIDYVLVGPRERRAGDLACVQELTFIASFGRVDIYATSTAGLLQRLMQ